MSARGLPLALAARDSGYDLRRARTRSPLINTSVLERYSCNVLYCIRGQLGKQLRCKIAGRLFRSGNYETVGTSASALPMSVVAGSLKLSLKPGTPMPGLI
jgi:hypothetical protein